MDARLKELQVADGHITALERDKSRLDDGTRARAERDAVMLALDEARKYLQNRESEKKACEDDLKEAEAKIKQQQGRLMSASSSHQVEALQRDIEGFGRKRGELDESILMLMDDIEGAQGKVASLEKLLAQHRARVAQVEEQYSDEMSRIQASLKVQRNRSEELRGALDAVSLQKYDASARKHAGVAVAWPVNGDCSGCGTALTPFNLKDAKAQAWPECENCGRLLLV